VFLLSLYTMRCKEKQYVIKVDTICRA